MGAAADAHAAAELTQPHQILDQRTRPTGLLKIMNTEEDQWHRFEVVELTEPVILPDESAGGFLAGWPAMLGATPSGEKKSGKIAILLEPIAPGKIGLAVGAGLVRTTLVGDGTHAEPNADPPDPDDPQPPSGAHRLLRATDDTTAPCEILWAGPSESPDAPRLALVRISNWHKLEDTDSLRGGCLVYDHPGRGEPFEVHLGEWDPAEHVWVYGADPEWAIDWRYGVPHPEAGATGLFQKRKSDELGNIWEVVALDCASPGACGD